MNSDTKYYEKQINHDKMGVQKKKKKHADITVNRVVNAVNVCNVEYPDYYPNQTTFWEHYSQDKQPIRCW